MRFRATVELGGKTATGFPVPDDVVKAMGTSRRPAVRVSIGSHTYPSTIFSRGGRFLIPLSAANRSAAGVSAGDEIVVEIEPDDHPREIDVPADLAAALAADETARTFFGTLSATNRKEWVRWVEEAKRPETRSARIAKTLMSLHKGLRTR